MTNPEDSELVAVAALADDIRAIVFSDVGSGNRDGVMKLATELYCLRAADASLQAEDSELVERLRAEASRTRSGYSELPRDTCGMLDEAADRLSQLHAENVRLSEYARTASKGLTHCAGLVGSEAFIRIGDEFYADPEFCKQRCDSRIETVRKLTVRTALDGAV